MNYPSYLPYALFISLCLLVFSCKSEDDGTGDPLPTLPRLTIDDYSTLEGDDGELFIQVVVKLLDDYEGTATVDFKTENASALYGMDYEKVEGQLQFTSPEKEKIVEVKIIADTDKEDNERFRFVLFNPVALEMIKSRGTIIITNDDSEINLGPDGYTTPNSYPGWTLAWGDEFEDDVLDNNVWTYEIGDGCPSLCGWGNNELEYYTDEADNVFLQDGLLTIRAIKESGTANPYTSTRIITKDKKELKFGRVDVRAKLPKGQGIWPAIWMLGSNIDQVSWPACGEIDIVELVGHEADKIHGTAHFGPPVPNNKFKTKAYSLIDGSDFSDRFHVFSVAWDTNSIYWYLDDVLFHELGTGDMQGSPYPFNQEFFFILNVAIGGNWPGPPDNTTVFPQDMVVDYVRIFQQQ